MHSFRSRSRQLSRRSCRKTELQHATLFFQIPFHRLTLGGELMGIRISIMLGRSTAVALPVSELLPPRRNERRCLIGG